MPTPTLHVRGASAYAQAMIELADEMSLRLEDVAAELDGLRELVEADAGLEVFMTDPSISQELRGTVLGRALSGQVSPLVMNLLRVLNEKRRLGLLRQIASDFQELLAVRRGIVEVEATATAPLEPALVEEVRRGIAGALGKEVVLRQHVDESILGGLVLRVGDKLIDASVRQQLRAMKERMLAAAPR